MISLKLFFFDPSRELLLQPVFIGYVRWTQSAGGTAGRANIYAYSNLMSCRTLVDRYWYFTICRLWSWVNYNQSEKRVRWWLQTSMAFWRVGPRSEKSSSISSSRILTRLIIPAFSTHEWASTHHMNWTGLSSSELEVCKFQREPPHWNKFVQNSLSTKRPIFAAAKQRTRRV